MSDQIMPAVYSARIWKGDTFKRQFKLKNKETGAQLDLDGAQVLIQVRSSKSDPTVQLEFENGDGISVVNDAIVVEKVVNIAAGKYVWDMQVTHIDGVIRTYWVGALEVVLDVSKP